MKLHRREFLVLAGTAAMLPRHLAVGAESTVPAGPLTADLPWHQKIKRVGQLNMNERDPVELDVEAWADYWAELKVDAVLVSVTGIVAFYQSDIPHFRPAAYLGDRDFFGD